MIIFSIFLILSSVFFVLGNSSETGGISSRIVGGSKINIERVPWQCAYVIYSHHICAGSIISKRWILTAAHCLGVPNATVRVGTAENVGGVIHAIKREIPHPQYANKTLDYDFGLLELTDDIQFNDKAKAIPLPSADQNFADGTMCLVTGWGHTRSSHETRDHLRGVLVPIYNQKKCEENFVGKSQNIVTDRTICAGYEKGGKDACQGDSGGPLIVFDGKSSNFNNEQYDNPILIGVVSWGVGCADPNLPGVYARIAKVRKWISDVAGI